MTYYVLGVVVLVTFWRPIYMLGVYIYLRVKGIPDDTYLPNLKQWLNVYWGLVTWPIKDDKVSTTPQKSEQ